MADRPITQKEKAFALYASSDTITLEDVSIKLNIKYETIRDWSRDDGWSKKREVLLSLAAVPDDAVDQAEMIRKRLFELIVYGDTKDAVVDLVKAWRSLLGIAHEKEETLDRDKLLAATVTDDESE